MFYSPLQFRQLKVDLEDCECLLCDTIPREMSTNVCSHPDREAMTDQSKETTQVQHAKPMNFISVTIRTEITQRQLHHQKPTPLWRTAHESWKPGVHCMTCRQLVVWRTSLPSILAGLTVSHNSPCFGREGPNVSNQFLGLPEVFQLFTF